MIQSPDIALIDRSYYRGDGLSRMLTLMGLATRSYRDVAEFAGSEEDVALVLINDDETSQHEFISVMENSGSRFSHVVYSEHPDWRRAVASLKAGAKTYIAVPEQIEEIAELVGTAEAQVSLSSFEIERRRDAQGRLGNLTRRELDVLGEVISGKTNKMIGEALGISARTVEIHRSNLLKKVGASNSADLVRIALEARADFSQK